MFGIDWNGDGKDDLLDDMITLEIIDDDHGYGGGGGEKNEGCLTCMLIMIMVPFSTVMLLCNFFLMYRNF